MKLLGKTEKGLSIEFNTDELEHIFDLAVSLRAFATCLYWVNEMANGRAKKKVVTIGGKGKKRKEKQNG